ncbi:hypothetical protein BY458DRAFT_443314, partial [Sporodiniella umbellata]
SLTPLLWTAFWKLQIPLRARTIWYKIIHKKVAHTSLLHRLMPEKFPSPLCPICFFEQDSICHFFFTCQHIQPVWGRIAGLFIDENWVKLPDFLASDILTGVSRLSKFSIRDPKIALAFSSTTEQIIACVIQHIWQARWSFIFHQIPVLSHTMIQLAEKSIMSLHDELCIEREP